MKKSILTLIAVIALAVPGGAMAGFFGGPDVPEGGTALTPGGEQSTVFVKDGFVFDSAYKHFIYDSNSHLALFSPAYDTDTRTSRRKLKAQQQAGKAVATTVLLKSGSIQRSFLDSMAADPKTWASYFKDQSCGDEQKLRATVETKQAKRTNLVAQNCTSLMQEANSALANIDSADHQVISGGSTERWKTVETLGLVPEVSIPWKYEGALSALQKANDPAVIAKIQRIMKDVPAEDEIVPLIVETKTITTQGAGHKTIGGNYVQGRTTTHEEKSYSASILTNPVFENKQLQAVLGNVGFTDDTFISHLKDFDYGLTNPDFAPDYTTGTAEVWIGGDRATLHKGYVPRGVYAWHRGFTASDHFFLPEANVVPGPGGEGRYITFPFFQDGITLEQYKTAWVTWHSMIQGMDNSEILKLVLFADVVRGAESNSSIHSAVNGKGELMDPADWGKFNVKAKGKTSSKNAAASMFGAPAAEAAEVPEATDGETAYVAPARRKKAKQQNQNDVPGYRSAAQQDAERLSSETYPGMMSYIVTHSIAPQFLRAVNLPTEWDVANPVYNNSNGANPGITAGEWFGLVLSAGGPAVNDKPAFQEFTKSLFAGDASAAKAVVNKSVSAKAVATQVEASKAALVQPELADQVKPKIAQAIAVNPMGIYKHLGEVLTGIFNPSGGK